MTRTFLVDLGSHTVKIGSVQTAADRSSEDMFNASLLSDQEEEKTTVEEAKCDEIPNLKGWPKITSLTQMVHKYSQEIHD